LNCNSAEFDVSVITINTARREQTKRCHESWNAAGFVWRQVLARLDCFRHLENIEERNNLDTPWLIQNTINNRDTQIIYFGITYHFGKPAKKAKDKSLQYDNGL